MDLLFATAEARQEWAQRCGRDDGLGRDMNLGVVTQRIATGFEGFPCEVLQTTNRCAHTSRMRAEILRWVMDDAAEREALEGVVAMIRRMVQNRAAQPQDPRMVAMSGVLALAERIACTEALATAVAGSRVAALRAWSDQLQALLAQPEQQAVKRQVLDLLARFRTVEQVSVLIGTAEPFMLLEETPSAEQDDPLAELMDITQALLGLRPKGEAVVFDPVPVTPIETWMLDGLEVRDPTLFAALYRAAEGKWVVREMQLVEWARQWAFYLGMAKFYQQAMAEGLAFCFPRDQPNIALRGVYDLSLALRNAGAVVANDIDLTAQRGFVLTGANQGGKTTFLRSLGLSVMLAGQGMMIPAASGGMPFFAGVTGLFAGAAATQGGDRLAEETARVAEVLGGLPGGSFVMMNELFTSTRRVDAMALYRKTLTDCMDRGIFFACVTHLYEMGADADLRAAGPFVSLVAQVQGQDNDRTYLIKPSQPGELAFAADIAEACGVTHAALMALWQEG